MNELRRAGYALLAAFLTACSSSTPQQRADQAAIAAMAPLKRQYSGLVMGFDLRGPSTLVISVDLQAYIDTDDDTLRAMKRDALTRWRSAWAAAHPHQHGILHVRFIDFVGHKVASETTKV